jgi:hypothetical protein
MSFEGVTYELLWRRALKRVVLLEDALRQRSRCATCCGGSMAVPDETIPDGAQWYHQSPDGSLIGPCFDPTAAAALAPDTKEKR